MISSRFSSRFVSTGGAGARLASTGGAGARFVSTGGAGGGGGSGALSFGSGGAGAGAALPLAGEGVTRVMDSGSSAGELLAELPLPNPLKLNPFFFSWGTGIPVMVLAISRMILEIEESSSTSAVPVFCIWRTAAKSLGIFHDAGLVRALVICSSVTPWARGS